MRLGNIGAVLLIVLVMLAGAKHADAGKPSTGRALVPKDLASAEQLFNGCQDAIIQAGYNINSMDKSSGLISASHEQGLPGSKKTYTYTWNVTVRPKEAEGATEIVMVRNTTGTFSPKDLKKIFPYIFEEMKLDLTKIDVTIDDETRKASEWK